MIYSSILDLVGNTPLIELKRLEEKYGLKAKLVAKVEFFNPAGSIKDRVGLEMINKAEKDGTLKPGGTIIEPTSGNTGVGLACVAAAKGYKVILTMPETMSLERRMLLKAYNAEVILTDGKKGMAGAIEKANELQKEIPGAIITGQFVNPANPDAHYKTTGPEIWRDTEGNVDYIVAGVGTGGTLTGTARYLKEQKSSVKAIAIEPDTSAVMSGEPAGAHGLQGIGAGFIPEIMDMSLVDEIIKRSTEDAYKAARELVACEGILCGITSGAALSAAIEVAKREENKDKLIVVILPDIGERYLSTDLYK